MEQELITSEVAFLANKAGCNLCSERIYYESLEDYWITDSHNGNDHLIHEKGDIFLGKNINPRHNCRFIGSAYPQTILQKWLRDHKGIIVIPIYVYNDNPNWCVHIEIIEKMKTDEDSVLISGIDFEPTLFDTYELALEKGLEIALKQIIN